MQNYNKKIENPSVAGRWYYILETDGIEVNHRLDGPAFIAAGYFPDEYAIMGEFMTKEEYYNHPEVIKYANERKLRTILGQSAESIK